MPDFTPDAMNLLRTRYLRDRESPRKMFERVSNAMGTSNSERIEFFNMLLSLDALPNTPCLINAGKKDGQLAACFALKMEDSIESIFETIKRSAIIHQSGGGTGIDVNSLRCQGSRISKTKGFASGPVSFLEVANMATRTINQGGIRRGANMGVLMVNHPDIEKFIKLKTKKNIESFNFSVLVTDEFIKAVHENAGYDLICPKYGFRRREDARKIWDLIVDCAHKAGCPGMIFIDAINKAYPGKVYIMVTNPCGEVPLEVNESCLLASINLANHVKNKDLHLDHFQHTIENSIRFLDNMVDVCVYPFPEIEKAVKKNRKLGLGVMGFHEYLVKLGIKYSSKDAIKQADGIASILQKEAIKTSMRLGKEKGCIKGFDRRNLTVTSIAPTGSIGRIAMTTHGIEPVFAKNSISNIAGLHFRENFNDKLFESAHEINYKQHIAIQAAFQKHIDNSVSKTINFPRDASKQDISAAFWLAYNSGCKGITIYRNRSNSDQPIKSCKTCRE